MCRRRLGKSSARKVLGLYRKPGARIRPRDTLNCSEWKTGGLGLVCRALVPDTRNAGM
jgi:hypothetical protein